MKTIKETQKWLIANRTDEDGDLILSNLNFSKVKGVVDISNMIVPNELWQDNQTVGGALFQDKQEVMGNLFQNNQKVSGVIKQDDINLIKYNKELKLLQEKYGIKG